MRNNGDLRLCTHAQHGTDTGLLRDDNGTPYNAGKDDISLSRNSAMLRGVRQSMLSGKWHGACNRCKHEQESGMRSRNMAETELWKGHFTEDDARRLTAADGSIDASMVPIRHYGLRFGNKCNLKCRMCGPTESSMWYEDYATVWGTEKYNDSFGVVSLTRNDKGKLVPDTDRYSWYESDKIWDHLRDNAANIVHVHTVGGEPTLIDEQYRFLTTCIERGISGNLIVEYNSNITAIPDRAWDLWRHFKEVRVGASIDGVGAVNDYIRHPSRWSLVEKNLLRIDTDPHINFVAWIAGTVQAYNILYIPELLEYVMRSRLSRIGWDHNAPLVNFHPLYAPKWLSTRVFPADVKRCISDALDAKVKRLAEVSEELYGGDHARIEMVNNGIRRHISAYTKFMWQEDLSHLMPKFWQYTIKLDELRGESFARSLPELHDIISSKWEAPC